MQYFMARTFDHGGYYETRAVLAVALAAFAIYQLREGDRRYLVMFLSGILFQGLMEGMLGYFGLRGPQFSISFFGMILSGLPAFFLHGLLEGGPISLMSFWFADLVLTPNRKTGPYLWALAGIVVLALITVYFAASSPATSVRPIFHYSWTWFLYPVVAIALTATRGWRGIRLLVLFAVGMLIYLVATYQPMQLFLVRYIATGTQAHPVTASLWDQIWVMTASHLIEVIPGKFHYLAVPLALGLLDRRGTNNQPTIVCLHGWLMSPEMWNAACEKAKARGFATLALWQPAHGSEPGPVRAWGMKDWTEWLFKKLDRAEIEDAILVGHSMGGMLALAAAAERPDRIKGLVLVGTSDAPWDESQRKQFIQMAATVRADWSPALANSLAGFLMGETFLEREPKWTAEFFHSVRNYDLDRMVNLADAVATRPDLTAVASKFGPPSLVVHGGADTAIPLAQAESLARRLRCKLVTLPNVAHCPPIEAVEEFAAAFDGYLLMLSRQRAA